MKPIPENRRWQEHRENPPEATQPPVRVQEIEVVVVEESPIINARYEGVCRACGRPIQLGMPITRHAYANCWVHVECRQAPVDGSLPARYPGFCRVCRQTIQVGELIVRDAALGWVHRQCLRIYRART